ncbi:MAG: glycosyl transferase family 2 [Rhizobiaceae bacterium]|nr:glycosyl transferase family 2 [Rhizobiaceae bacterium]MCV0406185.1 glycosyl transferase family 2 [Rhizobiaceae bacterium]
MLSVVIETENDEEGLARTLASLVPGAVEGIVREVIVCDRGSDDQTHRVAEIAGCHYLHEGGIAAAISRARSEWLLMLEPGARMLDGWNESVVLHIGRSTGAGRFVPARAAGKGYFLSRVLPSRRPLRDGLVITRRQAQALAGRPGSDAVAIAKAAAPRRLTGEIMPAPRKR